MVLRDCLLNVFMAYAPHSGKTDEEKERFWNKVFFIWYAYHILIQNELLERVDTFLYLGSLITEDGECTTELRTRLNRWQAIGASLQKIWKSHSIPISMKIRLMKELVWPVATNKWVLNKAGAKRDLLDIVKTMRLAYYGHTMRKQGSCPEK